MAVLRAAFASTVLAASVTFAAAQGLPETAADQAAGQAWWAHVKVLADDTMRGRLTGSDDYLRAAAYVVAQFKADGLQPAGIDGYYQPVAFDVTRVLADRSSMTLSTGCKTCRFYNEEKLVLGRDAILGTRGSQPKSLSAPLVFIGYGLHLPDSGYDDFNSPELPFAALKGKIVVFLNGGPADLPGALKSFARTSPLAKALEDAGVAGAISIPTPKSMDFGWERVASSASQPGMRLAPAAADAAIAKKHPALADRHNTMLSVTFNPAQAEKLFAGTGHTFAELLALADAAKPLPRFALSKTLTAAVASETTHVTSPNLVAKLEGSDPTLRDEFVLVSAHLDHLGVGAEIKGSTIYSGAMDDASGVASVLEIAKRFSQTAARPKRSMLFVIFTAEERPARLPLLCRPPHRPRKADRCRPQHGHVHAALPTQKTPRPGPRRVHPPRGRPRRRRRAPHRDRPRPRARPQLLHPHRPVQLRAGRRTRALAMKFGWTLNSPEYKAWRQWLADRYHSTQDNISQPVDFAAAAQFNGFLGDLARHVANDPPTPPLRPLQLLRPLRAGARPVSPSNLRTLSPHPQKTRSAALSSNPRSAGSRS